MVKASQGFSSVAVVEKPSSNSSDSAPMYASAVLILPDVNTENANHITSEKQGIVYSSFKVYTHLKKTEVTFTAVSTGLQ